MTVSVPPEAADRPSPFCGLCGRPMAEDQEWCLECGSARTVIARPPDWRVPLLVVGLVVALLVGGFVFALTQLGANAGRTTVIEHGVPAVSHHAAAGLAGWPPGEDGWTVIVADAASQGAADAAARALGTRLAGVGVLSTRQHPEMTGPATWDVFAGRYPSYALAQAAAARAVKAGESTAKPALVQRPGGG